MHNIPDFLRVTPEMQEHFAKGGMIKRADGSYSKRGLWDNIRANKGSGRKPTKEMLEQEAKIRAEEQYGGVVDQYGNGGYTVRRSHDRKGKTHVVIGPDGTKKYFGDPNMGERGKSKHGKEAFYARHAKNLKNNPYFRAYARATWKDGGEIPEYQNGTSSVDPSQLSQDQLTNWNRFQYYASKNANITDPAYNTNRQMGYDLLNQYNQANPNNQVPTDSIPTYQAYFQKLQAGQTNVGQAGQEYVQKNFTQGVSPQDAFIGTQTLGSRVPMRGKKTVTNANTGQVVYNSGARTSTALPTPAPSQPVAQTNTAPVPGMQTATLAYGGYYKDGGTYGPFYGRRDAAKLQRWRNPTADSMTPSFFAMGGLNKYQDAGEVNYNAELAKWKKEHGQPTYSGNGYLATANYPDDAQFVYNAPAGTTFGRTVQAPAPVAAAPVAIAPVVTETPAPVYNVERMGLMPTRGLPIDQYTAGSIPTSLIKSAPTTPSYLQRTYESTEGIPKTVLHFFDTKKDIINSNDNSYDRVAELKKNIIFDAATKKAYEREYNPETGKFKIKSYKIRPSQLKEFTENPISYTASSRNQGIGYVNDTINNPSLGCKTGECLISEDGTVFDLHARAAETDPEENYNTTRNFGNNKDNSFMDSPVDSSLNFITINSDKSFDENINLIKENEKKYSINSNLETAIPNMVKTMQQKLGRKLTEEEIKQVVSATTQRETQQYNPNDVLVNHFANSIFYVPEAMYENPLIEAYNNGVAYSPTEEGVREYFRDNHKNKNVVDTKWQGIPSFEERLKNDPLGEYQYYLDEYKKFIENEQNKKFRSGGSIRRFDIGGKNQVVLNQQQAGVYNLGQMGPSGQGNYQPTNYVTNIGQQQAGNQNIGQQGPAQTVPQTANSGQGVNTTTPAVNPATGPFATNIGQQTPGTQNLGQLGPAETAPKSAMAGLMERKNSIKSGLKQGYNNFKNSVAGNDDFQLPSVMGNEGYGQNMKVSNPETSATADNTKTATTPTSKNQPSLSQTIAQMNHGLNGTAVTSGDTAVVDQGLQNYFNSKDHQFLQGIDQVQSGLGRLARGITSINPNSQNAAVLGFDRRMNDTLTNRMTIAAPRKGIEYAKYGGKMSLKEGEELDLSTEQIHQLEKLGYKFQIL